MPRPSEEAPQAIEAARNNVRGTGQSDNEEEQDGTTVLPPAVASGAGQDPAQPSEDARPAFRLCVNTNQFYMQGFSGVLDIRLENLGSVVFETVDVEVSGNLLNRTEPWSCRLDPGHSVPKRYAVKPLDPGVMMATFQVHARHGDSVDSYWAEGDLLVFANTQNLHDIKLQADNMVNVSAGTGKQMGNSVTNNISVMVDQGKIRNVNDLMREYRKLPPEFKELHLERQSAPQWASGAGDSVTKGSPVAIGSRWTWACLAAGSVVALVLIAWAAGRFLYRADDLSTRVTTTPPARVKPKVVQQPQPAVPEPPGRSQPDPKPVKDSVPPAVTTEPAQATKKPDNTSPPPAGGPPPGTGGGAVTGGAAVSPPPQPPPQLRDPKLEEAIKDAQRLLNQGMLDLAQERIESALKSYPEDPSLKSLAEEVDQKRKQKEEAEARRAREDVYK